MTPRLTAVIPHWALDAEIDDALRACLSSLPPDCEKIVVVNEGTGFAANVNLGLRLATGDYVAVVTNDSRVVDGDVYDLCVPGTVTSPLLLEKPGVESGGFHGAFWVHARSSSGLDSSTSASRARSSRTTITSNGCGRKASRRGRSPRCRWQAAGSG